MDRAGTGRLARDRRGLRDPRAARPPGPETGRQHHLRAPGPRRRRRVHAAGRLPGEHRRRDHRRRHRHPRRAGEPARRIAARPGGWTACTGDRRGLQVASSRMPRCGRCPTTVSWSRARASTTWSPRAVDESGASPRRPPLRAARRRPPVAGTTRTTCSTRWDCPRAPAPRGCRGSGCGSSRTVATWTGRRSGQRVRRARPRRRARGPARGRPRRRRAHHRLRVLPGDRRRPSRS